MREVRWLSVSRIAGTNAGAWGLGTAPLRPELADVPSPHRAPSSVSPYLGFCSTLGSSPPVYHSAGTHSRCRRRFLCEVCRSRVLSSPCNHLPVTLHRRYWYISKQVCNRSLTVGNGHPEQFIGGVLCEAPAYRGPPPGRLSGHDSPDGVIATRPFHTQQMTDR